MPTLPAGMIPQASDYGFDDPGGVIRTEVAGGASRFALDWDRGPQRFTISLILEPLEFSVWTAFYHKVIKKGAISFDMPLDSGFGVTQHLVNIIPGSYSVTRTGGIITLVSFGVEAENEVNAWDDSDGEALVSLYAVYGRDIDDLLTRLAQFATVDLNVL